MFPFLKKIDNALVIVGVGFVILGIAFVAIQNSTSSGPSKIITKPSPTKTTTESTSLTELLKNSEVMLPGVTPPIKVKLVNGTGTYENGDEVQTITFISEVGKTNISREVQDVFVSYAANYGGSGSFVYVGLNQVASGAVLYTSSTDFLGDRVSVKTATASSSNTNSYQLTVNYLDRNETDPMSATPTVPKSQEFEVIESVIQKEPEGN